ncbi:MAG: Fpg/Nei family DNA glycosylase [Caldiserica bacterium]|jgi:formamidopyrimidine-DNA glycosylase|nr:Fpg/Nei family DNA glycosylase [Caldisericota bacterium]MDH7562382.1 DNA-formamidopyrimidine glycosylase family protein [Caldisericota bacterium]
MPELPEIWNLARQMDETLRGKRIAKVEIKQPKCLNLPPEDFQKLLVDKEVQGASSRGKWVFLKLSPGVTFLLNLGMGGEVLYFKDEKNLPQKYRLRVDFQDGSLMVINFFWFGYAHALGDQELPEHFPTAVLGMDPMKEGEFTLLNFKKLLKGKKGGIKAFLMDQKNIAGIGNVYIQDILFTAGLHPNRKIPSLKENEVEGLFKAIGEVLKEAADLGGLAYETDLFNRPGRFKDFLVGYREGKPCPSCGLEIKKIKTGSTSSYICPSCQK